MENNQNIGELRAKSTPRDVFLHLLMIVTLYLSVISFITLWFQYVNVLFPDPLYQFGQSRNLDLIRWATAVLLVSFPVYLFISWVIGKDFSKNPKKLEYKLRKWLLHLTLFIAAITIIVDLITLIYRFYGGDLRIQFLLKVFVVLAVAIIVFGYYIWDLNRKDMRSRVARIAAGTGAAIILGSIIGGFFIVGSPFYQRQVRFDERRIDDLMTIQGQIIYYWQNKNNLPESLDALTDSITGFVIPKDPETKASYEYIVKGNLSFELCAIFSTKGAGSGNYISRIPVSVPVGYEGEIQQNWNYDKGRVCFERTIDPDLYKIKKL